MELTKEEKAKDLLRAFNLTDRKQDILEIAYSVARTSEYNCLEEFQILINKNKPKTDKQNGKNSKNHTYSI